MLLITKTMKSDQPDEVLKSSNMAVINKAVAPLKYIKSPNTRASCLILLQIPNSAGEELSRAGDISFRTRRLDPVMNEETI